MIINKKIFYIDFEYSGFDEISKLFAVYFTQPEKFFNYDFYKKNKFYLKKNLPNTNMKKMDHLLPISVIRWCLILYKKIDIKNVKKMNKQYNKIERYFSSRKRYIDNLITNN